MQRRFSATILVEGSRCSGVVTDDAGQQHPFGTWLQFLRLLRESDGAPEDRAVTPAGDAFRQE